MRSVSIKLLALLGLSLAAGNVGAQTLTFNLTGNILPGVCRFSVSDVDLGTFYATEFTAVGTTKAWVNVPVASSGCDPLVTVIHMGISGTADVADASQFRGVAGIGIELQSGTGTAIRPAGTNINFTAASGAANYMLRARFRQTAAVVAAGTVRSPVTIQVTYN
ncbi:fimbrial protein [Stenotrophomonas maltophilia]|uniref:fimbrial protein n=1 Tax=Stenotrophomonas maltophilia TaxID=40324 RepID=UPI0015DFBD33|nr:fimbrial protein [Stenotrophomonas maltophilia]